MSITLATDVCVIGAGAAGLSVASGAAQLGRKTVLIERGRMGGDCLNTGCVPSKALLAAAKAAASVAAASRFGVEAKVSGIDFARVHAHVRRAIAAIEPNDSAERFRGLGVEVVQAQARFTGPDTLITDQGHTIRARRFVIATGSRAAVPPIDGLERVPYLNNETLFEAVLAPQHLIVLGGGPIGVEMAQAWRRLGVAVTLLEKFHLLPKDDPELVALVRRQLIADGVALREGADIIGVEPVAGGVGVRLGTGEAIAGSHLLVATGRKPVTEGLDLAAAGVAFTEKGVTIDPHLRTTNRRIYAVGDVTGLPNFTHLAGQEASLVIRNMLFRLFPGSVSLKALPWVTYAEPELAQVGLTEAQAKAAHPDVQIVRVPFHDNDRAQAEAATEGMLKVMVLKGGKQVLGASIAGAHAGELIAPFVQLIARGRPLGDLLAGMAPYPTLGEAARRAAGAVYGPKLFNDRVRRLVAALAWFG